MYAVYSIDGNIELNTYSTWDACSKHVIGHNAVYKKVLNMEAATLYFKEMDSRPKQGNIADIKHRIEGINEIEGQFIFPIFYSEKNGYCVYQYELPDGGVFKKAIVKGYFLPKNKKVSYLFKGKFIYDKKYGVQFDCQTFEEKIDCSKEGLVSYLSSGVIKGIGEKTAARIYDMFGEKSLEVLEKDPGQYLKIKGITQSRLTKIQDSYMESRGAQIVTRFLMSYNIPPSSAMRAFKDGITSISTIKENPYCLCRIRGITFYMADAMARRLQISDRDPNRIDACARFILLENEKNTGSLCMEKDAFGISFLQELNSPRISRNDICGLTIQLITAKKLIYRKVTYYDGSQKALLFLPERYSVEKECANNIYRIYSDHLHGNHHDLEAFIRREELKRNIRLDPLQHRAVITAVKNPVCIINGGPGMGKTTIQGIISNYLSVHEPDKEVLCIAPTGIAARRLTEATGIRASTIHSLLGLKASTSEELIDENDYNTIENATVIMDETSMTDIYVLNTLLRAMGEGCRLILVGDIGQLPSVGPGAILRDIVKSGLIPVIELKNIFRQEKGSMIYQNTQNIRQGIPQIETNQDFTIFESDDLNIIQEKMLELYQKRIDEYGSENVLLLCPYKKYNSGVYEMNRQLQNLCNKPEPGKKEYSYGNNIFRVGDRVMNTKNTPDVANGDIGIVEDICTEDDEVVVKVCFFGSTYVNYNNEKLENLVLAYATTVHKAEGSQADCLITCFTSFHQSFLFRNFPLTAISRGKVHVDYLGPLEVLKKAIQTEMTDNRLSLFWYHLAAHNNKFMAV